MFAWILKFYTLLVLVVLLIVAGGFDEHNLLDC